MKNMTAICDALVYALVVIKSDLENAGEMLGSDSARIAFIEDALAAYEEAKS